MEKDKKIGVALGGGSALGFAHLGVLESLEENNVSIDYISGTSAGAVAGVLYAFGVSFKEIEKEAEQLTWKKLAKINPSKLGVASNVAIREILERQIGKKTNLEDAPIPLAIVTTNIDNGEKVVLKSGNAIEAVMASSCLPGLFSPVEIDKKMLVDGGIVENVPISPLKEFGAEIIIGVNLLRHRKYEKPKSIIGVLVNSFDMINHRISAQPKHSDANFLIEPDLSDYYMGDLKKWKQISKLGYLEMQKFVLEVRNLQRATASQNFFHKIKELFLNK